MSITRRNHVEDWDVMLWRSRVGSLETWSWDATRMTDAKSHLGIRSGRLYLPHSSTDDQLRSEISSDLAGRFVKFKVVR